MPKRLDPAVVGGLVLILVGSLYLLKTLGMLENVGDVFWGATFLGAGLLFLFSYFTGSWWSAIPGCVLVGIGGLILLPDSMENIGGALFLGSIAAAFWLVYVTAPGGRWWAIIPAGALTTLAVITLLPSLVGAQFTGALFFLGFALTFALTALLAGMRWAWYPAGALAIVGLLVLLAQGQLINYLGAAALVIGGGYMVLRAVRRA